MIHKLSPLAACEEWQKGMGARIYTGPIREKGGPRGTVKYPVQHPLTEPPVFAVSHAKYVLYVCVCLCICIHGWFFSPFFLWLGLLSFLVIQFLFHARN